MVLFSGSNEISGNCLVILPLLLFFLSCKEGSVPSYKSSRIRVHGVGEGRGEKEGVGNKWNYYLLGTY